MEIFLFLVRRKAAATSCAYNPLVSLTLQYNTSSNIYYSARERENHCARVVRISLCPIGWTTWQMRNLSIHLLHAIVSFTPSCVLYFSDRCVSMKSALFSALAFYSLFICPPPLVTKEPPQCATSVHSWIDKSLTSFLDSSLLSDCCWSTNMLRGGTRNFFF